MNEELIEAFDMCWDKIKDGATIEECLRDYPNLSQDLQPFLETAIMAQSLSVSEVSNEVINRSRTRLLGNSAQMRHNKPAKEAFMRFPLVVISAVLLTLVFILGSRELIVVSAESLPGDDLYPIKRAVQDIRVRFTPNRELKHEMENQYRGQRIKEVIDLLAIGRIERVSFEGVVEKITPTRWIVDGIKVILSENTIVVGDISIGSLIEIEGLSSPGGWIEAHELHLREFEFAGQVESIDFDSWIISNIIFEIISRSQIYSGAQVGDDVLVLARTRDDGSQYALAIIELPSYMYIPDPSSGDTSTLTASKNIGEELEFSGIVEYISYSYWVIDGYTVMVSLLTEVKEEINLGDRVKVQALIGEDGSLFALEVDLDSDDVSYDQDDDNLQDEMLEDEQVSDDDRDQPDDEGSTNDNSGNDNDGSDNMEGENNGSDSSEDSEREDDPGEGGSSNDEDNSEDEEIEGDVESDPDEVENNEEPEEIEEPVD